MRLMRAIVIVCAFLCIPSDYYNPAGFPICHDLWALPLSSLQIYELRTKADYFLKNMPERQSIMRPSKHCNEAYNFTKPEIETSTTDTGQTLHDLLKKIPQ